MNLLKGTKIYSIFTGKCPVCQEESMMYVSYALGVAFAIATFIIAHFFLGFGLFGSFISIIVVLVLLMPIIMRLSRNIWINFFLSYKKTN